MTLRALRGSSWLRVVPSDHALVLQRGAAQHRVDLAGDGRAADRLHQFDVVDRVTLEEGDHELVVVLRDALDLDASGIRIHGTSKDWSIGTAASHGCMRMHMWDVEDLFPRLKFCQNAVGACTGPFDSWLTLRGLERANLRWLERYEGPVVGGILIALGLLLFAI